MVDYHHYRELDIYQQVLKHHRIQHARQSNECKSN